jgi:hypothetical protein
VIASLAPIGSREDVLQNANIETAAQRSVQRWTCYQARRVHVVRQVSGKVQAVASLLSSNLTWAMMIYCGAKSRS